MPRRHAAPARIAPPQARTAEERRLVRVRLTDDADPIDLFSAPLRDRITVQQQGRYPAAADVFRELESAYERNRSAIANEGAEP